jgi:hypothetical protein
MPSGENWSELTFDKIAEIIKDKELTKGEVKVMFFTNGYATNAKESQNSLKNL